MNEVKSWYEIQGNQQNQIDTVLKEVEQVKNENKELRRQLEGRIEVNDNLQIENERAEEIIKDLYFIIQSRINYECDVPLKDSMARANRFLEKKA